MLDLRWQAFALALYLCILPAFMRADVHKVTLHGKLFTQGDPAECSYFLDPADDSQSISISAASSDYLCDYMQGSANRGAFTITLAPE